MNNDPFAQNQPPEFLPDEANLPQRTSIMAILSLVFSLICCIPGLGAIGAILGGASLVSISRSQGRITGTGLAVAGIVIGLVVSIVWIGAVATTSMAFGIFFRGSDAVMSAVEADNITALKAELAPTAAAVVTDAEVDAFRAAYQTEYGSYVDMPRGIGGHISGWLRQGSLVQTAMNRARGVYPPPDYSAIPLVATFDQGEALVILVAQQGQQTGSGAPAPVNIGVVAPDGSFIWLIDPAGASAAPGGP